MSAKDTDVLRRWEDHGATWRAIHVSDAKAIVDLCTCMGEPVDRIESDDPDLIAFLRERPTSEAGPG
jgi:hypothetical protein